MIPKAVQPGKKIRVHFGPEHRRNHVLHVRALVDDRVVVRRWSRGKQRWDYEVLEMEWFMAYKKHISLS